MRQRLTLSLLVCAVVVYPVVALGADAKTSATSELLTWLLGLVGTIVLVLIQQAIARWLKPKVSKETGEMLDKIAERAINYAEESGRSVLKENGQKLASNDKLERAATMLVTEADKFGAKDMDLPRARKFVEAALSKTREAPLPTPPIPLDTDGKVKKV